jgi:hypothetical protein
MNERLGEWILGEMLTLESKILDGDRPSTVEPIGILNDNPNTRSDAPAMSVDELVDLFNAFPRRPAYERQDWRPMYRPGPLVVDPGPIPFPTSIA